MNADCLESVPHPTSLMISMIAILITVLMIMTAYLQALVIHIAPSVSSAKYLQSGASI